MVAKEQLTVPKKATTVDVGSSKQARFALQGNLDLVIGRPDSAHKGSRTAGPRPEIGYID